MDYEQSQVFTLPKVKRWMATSYKENHISDCRRRLEDYHKQNSNSSDRAIKVDKDHLKEFNALKNYNGQIANLAI